MADPVDPPTADAPADLTGRTVGDFQVLRKLGQGGMGQVNIVQVFATGEHDGLRYMALEYVDGRNLRDYLARKGPPDLPVALAVMRQVAAALLRASEIGLVHRDIKPENILVTRKVEVKVADFGLSRYFAAEGQPLNLTQSGVTLGTPLYMSPEQVQGHPTDHRSDIYSFGVTCYHLLAGHPPFQGTTPFEVAVQHVQSEPPPLSAARPDLPADLCGVVHKMMAKKPADRYQTARDILRDLARVQKGVPVGLPLVTATTATGAPVPTVPAPAAPTVAASPTGVPGSAPATTAMYIPAPSPPSGGRWALRAAGAAAVAGLAVLGWWGYGRAHPPTEASAAAGPGLPDARPPEPVTSARERELRARFESRATKPADAIGAAVELGLLYVRERRLDDADKVFEELKQERFDRTAGKAAALNPARLVGQLGQAVVLAHRDKAKESNELFTQAIPARGPGQRAVELFLFAHPDFGQAVADALNRNAENLGEKKLSERLEWLRTPSGLARGPKGG